MLAGFANWLMRQAKGVWGLLMGFVLRIKQALGWGAGKVRQRKIAAGLSILAMVILIGVAQAGGPMGRPQPVSGGMNSWHKMRWWVPRQPIPMMTITDVDRDSSVFFTTKNLPENETFAVFMGKMGTRGLNGIRVGSFDSSDGVDIRKFPIPAELQGDKRIAIRITTDHMWPYYAFNWFYNNTTINGTTAPVTTSDAEEAPEFDVSEVDENEAESEDVEADDGDQTILAADGEELRKPPMKERVPSFMICAVEQDNAILVRLRDFPTNETFKVQMGVMPTYPAGEPNYNGQMKWMEKDQMLIKGRPMPPMPPNEKDSMNPPAHWIPYYDAGMLETGREVQEFAEFKIPHQLSGAYRISILMRTRHAYPYYAYNWFYNNDANVCFNDHENGDGPIHDPNGPTTIDPDNGPDVEPSNDANTESSTN